MFRFSRQKISACFRFWLKLFCFCGAVHTTPCFYASVVRADWKAWLTSRSRSAVLKKVGGVVLIRLYRGFDKASLHPPTRPLTTVSVTCSQVLVLWFRVHCHLLQHQQPLVEKIQLNPWDLQMSVSIAWIALHHTNVLLISSQKDEIKKKSNNKQI